MRAGKRKGAAAAIVVVDLMKDRRERFRIVFIIVELISPSTGEASVLASPFPKELRARQERRPPEGVYKTACNQSSSRCPAPEPVGGGTVCNFKVGSSRCDDRAAFSGATKCKQNNG